MKTLKESAVAAAAALAFAACPATAQDMSAEKSAIEAITVAWGVH